MFYNEFFTPPDLIEKMLSHIPESKWNTRTKWLEPTCGDGGFMIAVFQKLFHHPSVKEEIPDEEERRGHIYGQLYMVDINPINIEKTKQKFGGVDVGSHIPHIFCEDFLSWNGGDVKFDVIVGNPPFQTPSENYLNGNVRKGSGKKMYEKILDKALTLLQKEGHLCFLTPLNLWSGQGSAKNSLYEKILAHYHPQYIYLNNLKKRWFPHVGQNLKMCFFVIVSQPPGKTRIENVDGKEYEVELKKINPVSDWTPDNVAFLESFLSPKKTKWFIRTKDENRFFQEYESGYPLIQNPDRYFWVLPTEELRKNSHYGEEKLILFRMKPFEKAVYDNGCLLLSSQIYFLPLSFTEEEKTNIISFFHSEDYQKLMRLTTTSQFLKGGIIDFLDIDKIKMNKTS